MVLGFILGFQFGSSWVPVGFQLGSSWVPGHLVASWGHLGAILGFQLGSSWVPVGFQLGSSWVPGHLVASWGHLGLSWRHIGFKIHKTSKTVNFLSTGFGVHLGVPAGFQLGSSWVPAGFQAILWHLGAILGPSWGPPGALLGPSWEHCRPSGGAS